MTNANPEIIFQLNAAFSKNSKATELTTLIAQCVIPILLDWNGVLASDLEPIELNPETRSSLRYILEHGITPFIITLADNWSYIHDLLKEVRPNVLQEVVIMTNQTWALDHPYPPWNKRVRHLFPGRNTLAIIDNDKAAVTKNPGMKGFHVKTYKPLSELIDQDISYAYESLTAATKAATAVYKNALS